MAFRFDMQSKAPQQQAIVAKKDAEDKRRCEEAAKKEANSKTPDSVKEPLINPLPPAPVDN